MVARTKMVGVRVTAEEHAQLVEFAEQHHCSVTELIRRSVGFLPEQARTPFEVEVMRELRALRMDMNRVRVELRDVELAARKAGFHPKGKP